MTPPEPISCRDTDDPVRPDDPLWRATVEMADHATAADELDESGPAGPLSSSSEDHS